MPRFSTRSWPCHVVCLKSHAIDDQVVLGAQRSELQVLGQLQFLALCQRDDDAQSRVVSGLHLHESLWLPLSFCAAP